MNYLKKMQDRDKSGFDLSVGTGMALQALFNTDRPLIDNDFDPMKIDVKSYDVFMVNWYTILRNIVGALDKETRDLIFNTNRLKDDLISIANMELEVISQLCENEGVDFVVLAPNYKKLSFVFNEKLTRTTELFKIALDNIKRIRVDYEDDYNPKYGNVLLLSHLPFDLLINKSNVDILQSHKGEILSKHQYNKKYRKTTLDTSFLPFNGVLLFILADETNLLKLLDRKARKETIEVLSERGVNQRTTVERIKYLLQKTKYANDMTKMFKNPY